MPGALIPYIYFEYLRTGEAARLLPVFQHNAIGYSDARLPDRDRPVRVSAIRYAAAVDMARRWPASRAGCGRPAKWSRRAALFRRAIDAGLPDELLFRTLWDVAALERKLGCDDARWRCGPIWRRARNPFRVRALEELAKHHEHRTKDYAQALEFTRAALELEDSAGLRKREERLARRAENRPQMNTDGHG